VTRLLLSGLPRIATDLSGGHILQLAALCFWQNTALAGSCTQFLLMRRHADSAGKYKSAGDQLLRRDMSEAQAEQLSALLDDIYTRFTQTVASARGKSEQEVRPQGLGRRTDVGALRRHSLQKLRQGLGSKVAGSIQIL
jgi:Peptidase family S49